MRGEELLRKYIYSGLNEDERFELEKLALDDEFLADAWEGIVATSTKDTSLALSRLNQKIEAHQSSRVVPIYWRIWPYAVAASLALLISVTFLLKNNTIADPELSFTKSEAQSESVALDVPAEIVPAEKRIAPRAGDIEVLRPSTTIESPDANSIESSNSNKSLHNKTISLQSAPASLNKEIPNAQEDRIAFIPNAPAESEDEIPNALTREKLEDLEKKDKPVPIPNDQDNKVQESLEIEGTPIILDDNQSINTATVINNAQRLEPVQFEEASKRLRPDNLLKEDSKNDSGLQSEIVLEEFRPKQSIIFQEKSALSRSITGGEPKVITDKKPIFPIARKRVGVQPEPVIGFEEFKKLMSENSQITAEDLFIRGLRSPFKTQMRFSVDDDGNLKDVEIINSLGGLNEKIIALFKTGGAWKAEKDQIIIYDFVVPLKKK